MGTSTWVLADVIINEQNEMRTISTNELIISAEEMPKWKYHEILQLVGKRIKERERTT